MRAAILGLVVVACAPTDPVEPAPAASIAPAPDAPPGEWLLPGTGWRLVALGGAPFEGRATAILTTDGRVIGEAPCNDFVAPYSGRWPEIAFAPEATTQRDCPDVALERAFFAALETVERAEVDADGLTLTGSGGPSLRFERID